MSPYDIYIFILCFIVFSIFTILFSTLLAYIVSLTTKLIKHGIEDEKITSEYLNKKEKSHFWEIIECIFSILLCIAFCSIFIFSTYVKITEKQIPNGSPSLKVVKSSSMSYKHVNNEYLNTNNLNDQIQMFDIILTHKLPAEYDLKLYDVIFYEIDGKLVIHRIVKIEEPNEDHPNERYFILQGDAVGSADRSPVLYNQMRGIYKGDRIPFVGSFIMFMQSPAGWLCILLIIIAVIATPIINKKIIKVKENRLSELGIFKEKTNNTKISNKNKQEEDKNSHG